MEDDHYLLIDGRRWRRSDPSIPESLRGELVKELMRARRAVAAARRAGDAEAERTARAHVQDAKVALGERGPRWWLQLTDADITLRAEAAMRALLRQRGADETICPSEVARTIGGSAWRARMQLVRSAAVGLAKSGTLVVRQGGKVVDPEALRGPIHLGLLSNAPPASTKAGKKRRPR